MTEIFSSFIKDLPSWMLVALGFYIAFRILKYPDLTVDASFIAGTVGTAAIAVHCHSSCIGLILALFLSALAGTMTGMIYISNPRPAYKLLSGVLVYLLFYSINYRVLGNKTDQQFSALPTFINHIGNFEAKYGLINYRPLTVLLGFIIVAIMFFFYRWMFTTSFGLRIRAIGSRQDIVSYSRGVAGKYTIIGLIFANMTVGLGGWFYGSINGFTSINIFGTILHALAAAIVGELLVERLRNVRDRSTSITTILVAPLVGAFVYLFVRVSVAWFIMNEVQSIDKDLYNLNSQDVNAVVAILIILVVGSVRFYSEKLKGNIVLRSNVEEEGI